jgi:hypothetical protein
MLTFNQALLAYGLEPSEVRLLRHQTRGTTGATPYSLWRDSRDQFEAYQAAQRVSDRNRLNSGFWASFVASPDGRTMLAGVYAVQGRETVPVNWPYPLSERPGEGQDELYYLDHLMQFAELEGRLYVEWGAATRAWIQRADRQDKQITELARTVAEPPFPGFSAFIADLSQIAALPVAWREALGAARGIYLLACPRTGELYVGSASGGDGFIGRWDQYAADGHGGNLGLKGREPSNFQVSILEVAGSLASVEEIIALEERWKVKLRSRQAGLNRN